MRFGGVHEHEAGCVFVLVQVDFAAVCGEHLFDGRQQAEADREHHGCRRRVADPSGAEGSGEAAGEEDALRVRPDPFSREQPVGESLVETVLHHGFREDEAAHEQEDHRVCKCCECSFDADDASDDGERRPDEGGDGDGHRLCDPPESDEHHDRQELVARHRQGLDRGQKDEDGEERAAEKSDGAAFAVEGLFGFLDREGFFTHLVQIKTPPLKRVQRA